MTMFKVEPPLAPGHILEQNSNGALNVTVLLYDEGNSTTISYITEEPLDKKYAL